MIVCIKTMILYTYTNMVYTNTMSVRNVLMVEFVMFPGHGGVRDVVLKTVVTHHELEPVYTHHHGNSRVESYGDLNYLRRM